MTFYSWSKLFTFFVPALLAVLAGGCSSTTTVHQPGTDMIGQNEFSVGNVRGDFDTPPVFLEGKAALVPASLRYTFDPSKRGSARLRFTVTSEGKIRSPKVVSASHPQYAAAVAHVMPTWKFKPALKNGVPVEVEAETEWTFLHDDF